MQEPRWGQMSDADKIERIGDVVTKRRKEAREYLFGTED